MKDVVSWGGLYNSRLSDTSTVAGLHSNIMDITTQKSAFAALLTNHSVVSWGHGSDGGDSSTVSSDLHDVVKVFTIPRAFAVLRKDRSVFSWGDVDFSTVAKALEDVPIEWVATTRFSFIALPVEPWKHPAVVWGTEPSRGSDASTVSHLLYEISTVHSALYSTAVLTRSGTAISWGGLVPNAVIPNVTKIIASNMVFTALREDGSITDFSDHRMKGSWSGYPIWAGKLMNIYCTQDGAYAGLLLDNSLVTWGVNGPAADVYHEQRLRAVASVWPGRYSFTVWTKYGLVTWGGASARGVAQSIPPGAIDNINAAWYNKEAWVALDAYGNLVSWEGAVGLDGLAPPTVTPEPDGGRPPMAEGALKPQSTATVTLTESLTPMAPIGGADGTGHSSSIFPSSPVYRAVAITSLILILCSAIFVYRLFCRPLITDSDTRTHPTDAGTPAPTPVPPEYTYYSYSDGGSEISMPDVEQATVRHVPDAED
eukprot:TRINITY_DN25972_c0_g1_i1.p1 TRINITY_DN25972_c0_g1~~TRINITY_DN25972_c0_g1_i1.p1  ORF type:complete len:501 (+),score=9.37 TRINITY_DN25972_c0_g1_i1:57-1505(+)